MNWKKIILNPKFWLFILLILFFLPFFINPEILVNRNNDLLFFRQSFEFFKNQIINNHHLALWQNYSFSSSPYLGDPQNPLLYPINYLSLFMPMDIFFIFYIFFHFTISGFGVFSLAKKFKLNNLSSMTAAIIYALSPKFIGHLEQGHINMLAAYAYFPFLLIGLWGIVKNPGFSQSLILGISASFMFLSYPTIFIYAIGFGIIFLFWKNWTNWSNLVKQIKYIFLGIFIFLIISFPQIYAMAKYIPLTTRNLVNISDIGPNAVSIRRHINSIIWQYKYGLNELGAETVLSFGLIPLFLAIGGWWVLNKKNKVLLFIFFSCSFFLSLGTKTAFYTLLVNSFPLLLSLRITTRFWFIPILVVALLSGKFVHKFSKTKVVYLIVIFGVFLELFFFSQNYMKTKFVKAVFPEISLETEKILKEKEYFRIFCINNCPFDIQFFNKGLTGGYNPFILKNYFYFFQDAAGFKFNQYALTLPPYQVIVDKSQPRANLLGKLGVKYVLSPYQLTDFQFVQKEKTNSNYLYQNLAYQPRIYLETNQKIEEIKAIVDKPGLIKIPLNNKTGKLVISEIYNPNWEIIDENNQKISKFSEENVVLQAEIDQKVEVLTVRFLSKRINIAIGISWLVSTLAIFWLTKEKIVL